MEEELRYALAQEGLTGGPDEVATQRAAMHLARVLGEGRVTGADLGELDGVMPPDLALAAARGLMAALAEDGRGLASLPEDLARAECFVERADICFSVLEDRERSWTVLVAVDEAHGACQEDEGAPLSLALGELRAALDNLDNALAGRARELSLIAGLPYLGNCRWRLKGEYAADPPWWLDGWLEREARKEARR